MGLARQGFTLEELKEAKPLRLFFFFFLRGGDLLFLAGNELDSFAQNRAAMSFWSKG